MSHYLVKPFYYYLVQAPVMKRNSAPSPGTMLPTTLITGLQFNIVWGEGPKFGVSKVYELISMIVNTITPASQLHFLANENAELARRNL